MTFTNNLSVFTSDEFEASNRIAGLTAILDTLSNIIAVGIGIAVLDAFGNGSQLFGPTVTLSLGVTWILLRLAASMLVGKLGIETKLFTVRGYASVFLFQLFTVAIICVSGAAIFMYAMDSSYTSVTLITISVIFAIKKSVQYEYEEEVNGNIIFSV